MTSDPKGLGAVFDAHTDAEFKTRDIEATMATMDANPCQPCPGDDRRLRAGRGAQIL
jgi:hypothetical protein